jgi:transposase
LEAAIRNIAIERPETGESQNAIAARYYVHRSMMSRLCQLYQQSGSTNDGPRSGRPLITNPVEDRYIQVFQPRHKTVTSSQTPSSIHCLRRISAQTVRIRLREHGKRANRAYFGAVLKGQHRRARVRWHSSQEMGSSKESGSAINPGSCLNDEMA